MEGDENMNSDLDGDHRKHYDISVNTVPDNYSLGRHKVVVFLWQLIQNTIFNWVPRPFYGWRRFWLRAFGATIGRNVRVRPKVIVEFPWRLTVGDNSTIGEYAWIYNLAPIVIGHDCVISQYAKLVTGSHDARDSHLCLEVKPIVINDCSWIGAGVFIGPGVTIGEGTVVGAQAAIFKDLPSWKIVTSSNSLRIKDRVIN